MAEQADARPGTGLRTWGYPRVVEMQSEGGDRNRSLRVADRCGLYVAFYPIAGLLLMIPTLYKLAGQLTPFTARCGSYNGKLTHYRSGDHSDVMAVRQTGCAMLCQQRSGGTGLCADFANSHPEKPGSVYSFPLMVSVHPMKSIKLRHWQTTRSGLMPQAEIDASRLALNSEHPVIRGTSANLDTYFQSREATNPWYNAVYDHRRNRAMNDFAAATGSPVPAI